MRDEKRKDLTLRILQTSWAELGELFPYLDAAIDSLGWKFHTDSGMYTDGQFLYFSAQAVLETFEKNPAALRRGYLHMILHCLFLHLFDGNSTDTAQWDLACDITVEQIIEQLGESRLVVHHPIRKACLEMLKDQQYSAQRIFERLNSGFFPYTADELRAAFSFDDHSVWHKASHEGIRSRWEQLLLDAAKNKTGKGKRGSTSGSTEESISIEVDEHYDYRKFLRRFTFSREEVELDTESFDYAFCNFGMEHYGAMPLIEPLEYKEVQRLEELVIAIDTSNSCSSETVSRFLNETYEILSRQENFFRKMRVYFIQCDCLVQDVTLIRCREDWLEYAKKVRIHGRGGTSFTPVFEYVAELRSRKELKNLKALIYFTDGDGAYPTKPPDYETTFVLLKESGHPELIPKWAKVLLI